MNFKEIKSKIKSFVEDELFPLEPWILNSEWDEKLPKLNELRGKVKSIGLWLPQISKEYGGLGLTLEQHGEVSEIIGASPYGFYVLNCQAPDAGNMEILIECGSEEQKEQYLQPLLDGKIRSCFAMTEPDFAGSNPVKMGTVAVRENDHYIINGHKWFASGFDGAEFAIVMLVTDPEGNDPHKKASQIIVPTKAKGVKFIRNISIMGHPGGGWESHAEIKFNNVKVPSSNVLGEEGEGFAIAQKRLGPGRIHHCMRMIGQAERALELLCKRSTSRIAFGKPLAELGGNYDIIADCRTEIEMCRLLTLKAAYMMDKVGNKVARSEIAQIKVAVPNMALRVIDKAIQIHGGAGVSQDTPLAKLYAGMRTLRIADGPDEVHRRTVARMELAKYSDS